MIRAYKEEDLPRLKEIGTQAWAPIYPVYRRAYGEELFNILVPDVNKTKAEQIDRHCRRRPECVLVYEEEGKIVGFATFLLWTEQSIGEIGNNAVDPAWQGRGIAQQLYKAVLERFRKEGLRFAKVTTGLDEGHAPARRAYERAGFNIQTRDVTYYQKL
jgi:ribosomal protein S18 acetylase RimI-like enzyme